MLIILLDGTDAIENKIPKLFPSRVHLLPEAHGKVA